MNNVALDKLEFHDALLLGVNIDYVCRAVKVRVDYYETEGGSNRVSVLLIFREVGVISGVCNLIRIKSNSSVGNINYWVPAFGAGTTYIYLVDGCISIEAESVTVQGLMNPK